MPSSALKISEGTLKKGINETNKKEEGKTMK